MKKLLFLLLTIVAVLPLQAQIRGNDIVVNVVPDHQDWRYEVGQTATFKISETLTAQLSRHIFLPQYKI